MSAPKHQSKLLVHDGLSHTLRSTSTLYHVLSDSSSNGVLGCKTEDAPSCPAVSSNATTTVMDKAAAEAHLQAMRRKVVQRNEESSEVSMTRKLDGYMQAAQTLRSVNLKLKERETMLEELCTFRAVQEWYLRTGTLPPPIPGEEQLCDQGPSFGLLGTGIGCVEGLDHSGGPDILQQLLGVKTEGQMGVLDLSSLTAIYGRLMPTLAMLAERADFDPEAEKKLGLLTRTMHWRIQELTARHPQGHEIVLQPCSEAVCRVALQAANLSLQQLDRVADLAAIIMPRLDMLSAERRRLADAVVLPCLEPNNANAVDGRRTTFRCSDAESGGSSNSVDAPNPLFTHWQEAREVHEPGHLADRLWRTCHGQRDLIVLMACFLNWRILSNTQYARVLVAAYPNVPDFLVFCRLAVEKRERLLQNACLQNPRQPSTDGTSGQPIWQESLRSSSTNLQ